MLQDIRNRQIQYLKNKDLKDKKELGQFFTDIEIAKFMSSLINLKCPKDHEVRVIDAGAGYGMLSAAVVKKLLSEGYQKINVVLYELDNLAIDGLKSTMIQLQQFASTNNCELVYEIRNRDFVIDRPDLNDELKYDVSVINPPYFKYSVKESLYAKKTADLYKGDPNIYASFVAIVVSLLANDGQLIAITPRSFFNGLYFKGFRKFILQQTELDHIHIFKSRSRVFKDLKVLQENVIFKLIKKNVNTPFIKISSSICKDSIFDSQQYNLNRSVIIDEKNTECIIRVPESLDEYGVLLKAEKLPSTFSEEGYSISTGPVVEFRTRNYINKSNSINSVPLLRSNNISINGMNWDSRKDLFFKLEDNYEKHLIENNRYVLLKRFTSKDEKRRLVSSICDFCNSSFKMIGISNKLNYLSLKNEILDFKEAIGLSVIFNSKFMDSYFRCISGNTQVNATEIRIMKFFRRSDVVNIGDEFIRSKNDISIIDRIVKSYLPN